MWHIVLNWTLCIVLNCTARTTDQNNTDCRLESTDQTALQTLWIASRSQTMLWCYTVFFGCACLGIPFNAMQWCPFAVETLHKHCGNSVNGCTHSMYTWCTHLMYTWDCVVTLLMDVHKSCLIHQLFPTQAGRSTQRILARIIMRGGGGSVVCTIKINKQGLHCYQIR